VSADLKGAVNVAGEDKDVAIAMIPVGEPGSALHGTWKLD
jgi:hypothetical protein